MKYPIKGQILDIFGKDGVKLSCGTRAGVYKGQKLHVCTSAGTPINNGSVIINHAWPYESWGILSPEVLLIYGISEDIKSKDAIKSLMVRSNID